MVTAVVCAADLGRNVANVTVPVTYDGEGTTSSRCSEMIFISCRT